MTCARIDTAARGQLKGDNELRHRMRAGVHGYRGKLRTQVWDFHDNRSYAIQRNVRVRKLREGSPFIRVSQQK